MSENVTTPPSGIKFTDEEMNELKFIQQKYNEKFLLLGQLKLEQLKVEDAIKNFTESGVKLKDVETNLKGEFITVQKLEDDFLNKVTKKYGEGSLDGKTGLFIPKKTA